MVGAFVASFIMSEIISIAGVVWSTEMGYVIAFVVFIVMMFVRPGGIMAQAAVSRGRVAGRLVLARGLLAGALRCPWAACAQYVLHVAIQIFIWSFIGGAWSLMGRFGLVSLGHGAFLGVGAYTTTLLWNFYGLTPWIGAVVAVAAHRRARRWSSPIPCSRFQVIGHYFGARHPGGGRGDPPPHHRRARLDGRLAGRVAQVRGRRQRRGRIQFADKRVFYYGALGAVAGRPLGVAPASTARMARSAMEAIGEDETAAASVGIHVTPLQDRHHRAVRRRSPRWAASPTRSTSPT